MKSNHGKKCEYSSTLIAIAVAVTASASVLADQSGAYAPGRDLMIPHVSGDMKLTGTYENWKDKEALKASMAAGMPDHLMNYKDIRWLKQDTFNGSLLHEDGEKLFQQKNAQGKSCASCHGEKGKEFKGVAARYPVFDKKKNKVMALTGRINNCSTEYLKKPMPEGTGDNTLLAVLVTSYSHGMPIDLDVTSAGPLKASYEKGKDLFFKRVGHFNFACASCHTGTTVLKQLRGMRPSTPYGDAAQYPIFEFPSHPDQHYVLTMQAQIVACAAAARMKTTVEGSPEYTDMEVFLRSLSNGHPINTLSSYYGESLD